MWSGFTRKLIVNFRVAAPSATVSNLMYVTVESAEIHVDLVQTLGLPTVTDPLHVELFGYHYIDTLIHWAFDPVTQAWDVKRERARPGIDLLPCDLWTDEEGREVSAKIALLNNMAAPPFPADVRKKLTEPPFLYEGWLFAWTFIPELKRWELAPLGKR